jgi:hypothetical protein
MQVPRESKKGVARSLRFCKGRVPAKTRDLPLSSRSPPAVSSERARS